MGKSRTINTKFWEDEKVVENFTTEDKMFWLYLLTNKNSNTLGSYRLSQGVMARELGFHTDSVNNILKRFITYHEMIDYDFETRELLILNWSKYNWTTSPTFRKSIDNQLENIESEKLVNLLKGIIKEFYGESEVVKKETRVSTVKEVNSISDLFNAFWEVYPRKQGKGNAKRWFNTHKPNKELVDKMIKTVTLYSKSVEWTKEKGKYIPHPTTWLNGERWEDEAPILGQDTKERVKSQDEKLREIIEANRQKMGMV